MPKVTDEHLAARREQVLSAAWACFAREGFHATTMADVIDESRLSAGAVYRYFPSKESLIQAATERALGSAAREFEDVLREADPLAPAATLADLVARIEHLAEQGSTDVTRVALQAWAEALRSPLIKTTAEHAQGLLRAALTLYAERCHAAGALPAGSAPSEVAQVMLSTVLGFVVQRLLIGDLDADSYGRGLAGLLR